ncbi:hypothetical protein [Nostoc phage N1]|nr:hypothetical protein [Nostoc phage N1]
MENKNYFLEIVGNGGITMQLLQAFALYNKFVFDAGDKLLRDEETLETITQQYEDITHDAAIIHPDLFVYLTDNKSQILAYFEFMSKLKVTRKPVTKADIPTK